MDNQQMFLIRFENETALDANIKAAELRDALLDTSPEISVKLAKDDATTMDFGATLVLLFGTPVAIAIAKGIADYLRKAGGTISITTPDGTVIAKNVRSNDMAKIAEAFSKYFHHSDDVTEQMS